MIYSTGHLSDLNNETFRIILNCVKPNDLIEVLTVVNVQQNAQHINQFPRQTDEQWNFPSTFIRP